MMSRSIILLIVLLSILGIPRAHSTDKSKFDGLTGAERLARKSQCELSLLAHEQREKTLGTDLKRHEFQIVPSGEDADVIPKYEKYTHELVKPNGLLDRLTIRRTKQVVEFLKGQDLNAIAKAGLPVRHYLDGSQLVNAYNDKRSLIFEVVWPGPKIQHGYYRSDNPEQMVYHLLNHVAGHNNFAISSFFPHYRAAHVVDEQEKLDELLGRLYTNHDKDEVARFYLFMQTLLPLQDFYGAHYQTPSEFAPTTPTDSIEKYRRDIQLGQKVVNKHPKASTENVLPAFIENIPPHADLWMKPVASHMMKMAAFQPALVHTQVMNEGWATILEAILIKHMEHYHNMSYWVQELKFSHHGDKANITDPYWLGVEIWQIIYRKFLNGEYVKGKNIKDYLSRPYIAELPSKHEQYDAAFMRFADEEIISQLDDRQFLELGIDASWVNRMNLALVRRHPKPWEIGNMPPPPPPNPNQPPPVPWEIVSRDRDRVVKLLKNTVYHKVRFKPRVQLRNFTRLGSGEVELVLDDEMSRAVPVDLKTLAPSLYALSNIIKKPVSLECMIKDLTWSPKEPDPWWERDPLEEDPIIDEKAPLVRVRVVVAQDGSVRVLIVKENEKGQKEEYRAPKEIQFENERILKEYIDDLYLEDDRSLEWLYENNPRLSKLATQMSVATSNSASIESLFDHARTVASAIEEVQAMLGRRMLRALERAMKGKGGLKISGKSMKLKALPSAVTIRFDSDYIEELADSAEVAKLQFIGRSQNTTILSNNPFDGDEASGGGLHPVDGDEGDAVWGPGKPPPGDGSSGREPGDDANDPSWVPLPDDLYAKFIGEKVKIPNLKPKAGRSKLNKNIMRGQQNRRSGRTIVSSTLKNVMKKGYGSKAAEQMRNGEDPSLLPEDIVEDTLDTLLKGFNVINTQRDWVVKKIKPKPFPEIQAVVNFVMDGSGSAASHYDTYKRFIHDMRILIEQSYKGFKFNFIVFDGTAKRAKDEDEFFRMQLGGGTSYRAGLEMVRKIQSEEFPAAKWDRITFVLGDMEDWDQQLPETFDNLYEESEFIGVVRGSDYDFGGIPGFDLRTYVENRSKEDPYFGYVDLGDRKNYSIDDLRRLLKNTDE